MRCQSYHWFYSSPLRPSPTLRRACKGQKYTWSAVPSKWKTLGCPSTETTIDLYIVLNQENALIDALYEVSDPEHPRHIHLTAPLAPSFTCAAPLFVHLSNEQVAELVGPHPGTLELVTSWLVHHRVRSSSISTTHGGA
ncbi:hypothetical protein EDB89DRAFT_1563418 [Lactarius sanguifluus]|nr:hypothetical protein EDB89DRAFT_1563418 [Lactarius sanguifluus]